MSNLIPGYDYIGKGFNAFGSFDESAMEDRQRLFDTETPSTQTWTSNLDGNSYVLPVNVGVLEVEEHDATAISFERKSDVSEFFSIQAGIEGNYLAFSGQFDASYAAIARAVSEYQFGMAYAQTKGFAVEITEPTGAKLSPAVLDDDDYKTLPTTYTSDNRKQFFRFFNKYGTHFVRSVQMGGRLYYNVAIDKSYNFSHQQFEANLTLEYEASFGAKGDATANWAKLGQTWNESRQVHVSAMGGQNGILNALNPSAPNSFYDEFQTWLTSVNSTPGPVNFTLMGVDMLFSGDQADAVRAAMADYNQNHLFLEARGGYTADTGGSMLLNGNPTMAPDFTGGGLSATVIDRESLNVLFMGTFQNTWTGQTEFFDYSNVIQDLLEFNGRDDVVVALLFWGQYSIWGYPTGPFYDFLRGLGAGGALDQWNNWTTSSAYQPCAYAITGVPGWATGEAIEEYVTENGEQDWANNNPTYPALQLQVFLEPQFQGDAMVYLPT